MLFAAFVIAAVASLIIFAASVISNSGTPPINDNKEYVLKTHGDFLALYYGDAVLEIYDDIVVSALPALDRERFLNGVVVTDIEALDEILEDFD